MKDFYIDFSEYPEAVASVLYEEVQKHAFELGYEWRSSAKTLANYKAGNPIIIFRGSGMSIWIDTLDSIKNKMSVEEFLKMEKEPEYRVGMPMSTSRGESLALYLKPDGELPECFTGIALKHDYNEYQYITNGYYDPCCWKPIDPSRIKVTIK